MLEKIEKENWFDFDTIIATPDMMPLLGKLGRVLGPKGLMPNPKTGTVTMDVGKAVEEVKAGRVEYRTDSFGNIHGVIGKVSFTEEDLIENLDAFVNAILKVNQLQLKVTMLRIFLFLLQWVLELKLKIILTNNKIIVYNKINLLVP